MGFRNSVRGIRPGTITSTELAENAVGTEHLQPDAVTAKHTLTGPLIRTAASGTRHELDQGSRRWYHNSFAGAASPFVEEKTMLAGTAPAWQQTVFGSNFAEAWLAVEMLSALTRWRLWATNPNGTPGDIETQGTLLADKIAFLQPTRGLQFGEGRAITGLDFGRDSGNTGASSRRLVPHFVGGVPDLVVTGSHDPGTVRVLNRTGLDIEFEFYTAAGALTGGGVTRTTSWLAVMF